MILANRGCFCFTGLLGPSSLGLGELVSVVMLSGEDNGGDCGYSGPSRFRADVKSKADGISLRSPFKGSPLTGLAGEGC